MLLSIIFLPSQVTRSGGARAALVLSNGEAMPAVGFGTCLGSQTFAAVTSALESGYKLLDTAQAREWYDEDEVARAFLASGVGREGIWITTKLHPRDLGYDSTLEAVKRSMERFHTGYIDLFLLHYPRCWESLCGKEHMPKGTWRESWRALEAAYAAGHVRAIGVSNFSPDELRELAAFAKEGPHVVQSWADPLHQGRQVRAAAKSIGAAYTAYSSLGTQWNERPNPVLAHPVLMRIGAEHNVTSAEVALAWALARGMAVIPRSASASHQRASLRAAGLELSDDEVAAIDELDGTHARARRVRSS